MSSRPTTGLGDLLLRTMTIRPGTMLRTLAKIRSRSEMSFRLESSGVASRTTRWAWSRIVSVFSVRATPRSKTM